MTIAIVLDKSESKSSCLFSIGLWFSYSMLSDVMFMFSETAHLFPEDIV